MRRERPFIGRIGLVALLAFAGCVPLGNFSPTRLDWNSLASAGQKIEAADRQPSESEEVEMGRHMAGMLLGAAPLEPSVSMQRYVNLVGRWLTLCSTRPQIEWRFGVLADADVNAFAAPGGYVFVTRGLLDLLASEAELAGVLAHEISHVTAQHHLKAMRNENLMSAAADVGAAVGRSAGFTGPGTREFGQKVVNAAKQLYSRGLDKRDELFADEEALRLLSRAGYDPYAFVAVMQKLEARLGNDSKMALLLQTHPSPADRLRSMDRVLRSLPLPQSPATREDRFEQSLH